jgi:hypothetical protein
VDDFFSLGRVNTANDKQFEIVAHTILFRIKSELKLKNKKKNSSTHNYLAYHYPWIKQKQFISKII